jgi:SET domain-containing protein
VGEHGFIKGDFVKASDIHLILKPSSIQGIGVFTLTPIKKGEKVSLSNENDARIIPESALARLPKAYSQYHVPDVEENWWGPINYHCMSIGWYLNHSRNPNIDVSCNFAALRRIGKGEELTIDYSYWKFDWVNSKRQRHRPPWFKLLD